MPYKSKKQRRWAHTPAGESALGKAGVKEWDKASKGKKLPEKAKKKKHSSSYEKN
jgi:hypothetical protein